MSRQPYQGSAAWLAERRTGIGSSDVPKLVLGDEEQWRRLWAQKIDHTIPDDEPNEAMEWGHRLEDPIARAYTERYGHPLVRVDRIVRHRERRYAIASLDRRRRKGGRPVEIKKVYRLTDEWGPEGSAEIPRRIAFQVQWQAAIVEAEVIDVVVLFGAVELRRYEIPFDPAEAEQLFGLVDDYWPFVERGEIPPYPGPAAIAPTLRADEIEPDEDLLKLIEAHDLTNAVVESATEHLAGLKERIRDRLAFAAGTRGQLADGRSFTVSYRPSKERATTGWEEVAAGYRNRLLQLGVPEAEIDFAVNALTVTKPGLRPLIVRVAQETATHAA